MSRSRYLPLLSLAVMHAIVDASAQLAEPLWPQLETRFHLIGAAALSVAFIAQSLPTSISQAVFGVMRDFRSTPWLLWFGPVLAVVCMFSLGLIGQQWALYLLMLGAGIGIGAFHPEGAVAASLAIPENRTRALSVFLLGGTFGLGMGPVLSGMIVQHFGFDGLFYMVPLFLALIYVLWRFGGLRDLAHSARRERAKISWSELFEGRAGLALFLLLVSTLRLVSNSATGKILSFTFASRGYEPGTIGMVQAMFLLSASVGMFLMAFRFRSGNERRMMIWCPLVGVPVLGVMGWSGCPTWLLLAMLVPNGLILWGTTSTMVSYAQQLFPRGAGIASAITIGLSWGFSAMIQAPLTTYFYQQGIPLQAFHACIPCLILAALGAWLLPEHATKPAVSKSETLPRDRNSSDPMEVDSDEQAFVVTASIIVPPPTVEATSHAKSVSEGTPAYARGGRRE